MRTCALDAAGDPVETTAISPGENGREMKQKPARYCSVSE
jgi:hypothetical protein